MQDVIIVLGHAADEEAVALTLGEGLGVIQPCVDEEGVDALIPHSQHVGSAPDHLVGGVVPVLGNEGVLGGGNALLGGDGVVGEQNHTRGIKGLLPLAEVIVGGAEVAAGIVQPGAADVRDHDLARACDGRTVVEGGGGVIQDGAVHFRIVLSVLIHLDRDLCAHVGGLKAFGDGGGDGRGHVSAGEVVPLQLVNDQEFFGIHANGDFLDLYRCVFFVAEHELEGRQVAVDVSQLINGSHVHIKSKEFL